MDAADIILKFMADIRTRLDFVARELNLGGGMGVPYLEEHAKIDYASNIAIIARQLKKACKALDFPLPRVRMEPGRSIVADAGLTLYTVGTLKSIPGFRNYVSVDGGMPDNPRYALYGSQYTALIANRASDPRSFRATLAGRCCESGDLLGENMEIQRAKRGDTLAVLVTGAYNHSMASNYNRIPRPPVIMVKDGDARVVVKRETYEDITANDVI